MSLEVLRGAHTQRVTVEELEREILLGKIVETTPVRWRSESLFHPAGELALYHDCIHSPLGRLVLRLRSSSPPWFTALLLGLQLRLFLLESHPRLPTGWASDAYNWAPAVIEGGQVWRLFTYSQFHQEYSHFALNALFLAYLGVLMERALGGWKMLSLFILSSLAGGLVSIYWGEGLPSLGSSSGIFGLMAASVVLRWHFLESLPEDFVHALGANTLFYLMVMLVSGLFSERVDNLAHLGGLLSGGTLTILMQLPTREPHSRWLQRSLWGLLGLLLLGLWRGLPWLIPLSEEQDQQGLSIPSPRWWKPQPTLLEDQGLGSPWGAVVISARTRVLREETPGQSLIERIQERCERWEPQSAEAPSQAGWCTLQGESWQLQIRSWRRGRYLHEVYVQVAEADHQRYQRLVERLLRGVQLKPPASLLRAEADCARSPDQPRRWLRLGEEAALLGEESTVYRALRGLRQALPEGEEGEALWISAQRELEQVLGQPLDPDRLE